MPKSSESRHDGYEISIGYGRYREEASVIQSVRYMYGRFHGPCQGTQYAGVSTDKCMMFV